MIANAIITYTLGVLMILYAIVYRGMGANDWSGATIMIFIAVMGMSLQTSILSQRNATK